MLDMMRLVTYLINKFYVDIFDQRPVDNIRVIAIAWTLRGNIIRTALCWIV